MRPSLIFTIPILSTLVACSTSPTPQSDAPQPRLSAPTVINHVSTESYEANWSSGSSALLASPTSSMSADVPSVLQKMRWVGTYTLSRRLVDEHTQDQILDGLLEQRPRAEQNRIRSWVDARFAADHFIITMDDDRLQVSSADLAGEAAGRVLRHEPGYLVEQTEWAQGDRRRIFRLSEDRTRLEVLTELWHPELPFALQSSTQYEREPVLSTPPE